MAYTYPDKDDKITVDLIRTVSRGTYWRESEERALQVAMEYIRTLPQPRSLLDLGCGLGRLFSVFAPAVDCIVGLEPDAERCQGAVRSAAAVREAEVRVRHADSAALDPTQRFSAILSSHVLQHIPPALAKQMIQSMAAHCLPGGLAVVLTTHTEGRADAFTAETMEHGRRLAREVTEGEFLTLFDREGVLPVRLFAEQTVIELFQNTGFELLLRRRFHFDGAPSASYDDRQAAKEAAGRDAETGTVSEERTGFEEKEALHARDCMYIFRRKA